MKATDYPKPQHFVYRASMYRSPHQGLAVTFFCGIVVGAAVSAAIGYLLFVWSLRP